MIIDKLKAKGTVKFQLRDQDGKLKESFESNLVVNAGLAWIIERMVTASGAAVSHMAVGTSTTAAAAADTALLAEAGREALVSSTVVTTNVTNDSVEYEATFAAGSGTGALTEAGLFNAGSGGTMLSRTVFGVITKGALDSLTITWKITIL